MKNWKGNADAVIDTMWDELKKVPFDKAEEGKLRLAEDWLFFHKGALKEEVILKWFDENYSKGLAELMRRHGSEKEAILVYSDGYSISEERYPSVQEVQDAMEEAYRNSYPYNEGEEPDEITLMSDCGEGQAVLYDRGNNVYIWQII